MLLGLIIVMGAIGMGYAVIRYVREIDGTINIVYTDNEYELVIYNASGTTDPNTPTIGSELTSLGFSAEFIDGDPSQANTTDSLYTMFVYEAPNWVSGTGYVYVDVSDVNGPRVIEFLFWNTVSEAWEVGGNGTPCLLLDGTSTQRLARLRVLGISYDAPASTPLTITFEVEDAERP